MLNEVGQASEELQAQISVLESLQKEIHSTALTKGWWDEHGKLKSCIENSGYVEEGLLTPELADELFILARIMLMATELSEGVEARRTNAAADQLPQFDGLSVELADCIIRIFDLAGRFQLPVIQALFAKMEYNKSRPFKHGGKSI